MINELKNMVKPEKFGHLVYHFTVPLNTPLINTCMPSKFGKIKKNKLVSSRAK